MEYYEKLHISIHALREEGDLTPDGIFGEGTEFLSTPSARRATLSPATGLKREDNFYPRPPRGGRPHLLHGEDGRAGNFYPRPPRGGRRCFWMSLTTSSKNFYPRPPRGGRPKCSPFIFIRSDFYPRPPRGGRPAGPVVLHHASVISIHALREEGDLHLRRPLPLPPGFLSTPSARRATFTRTL